MTETEYMQLLEEHRDLLESALSYERIIGDLSEEVVAAHEEAVAATQDAIEARTAEARSLEQACEALERATAFHSRLILAWVFAAVGWGISLFLVLQ